MRLALLIVAGAFLGVVLGGGLGFVRIGGYVILQSYCGPADVTIEFVKPKGDEPCSS